MMIPVRVPADARPALACERRLRIERGHPMYDQPCPVCVKRLGSAVTVLILAGIAPEDRKPEPAGRWATGAAICVHAVCAGYPEVAHTVDCEPETGSDGCVGHSIV
jgi:hypothetical protein